MHGLVAHLPLPGRSQPSKGTWAPIPQAELTPKQESVQESSQIDESTRISSAPNIPQGAVIIPINNLSFGNQPAILALPQLQQQQQQQEDQKKNFFDRKKRQPEDQTQTQQPLIVMILPPGQMMPQMYQQAPQAASLGGNGTQGGTTMTAAGEYQMYTPQQAELPTNIAVPTAAQESGHVVGGARTVPDVPENVTELRGSEPGHK